MILLNRCCFVAVVIICYTLVFAYPHAKLHADIISDFTGQEVAMSVVTTGNGGQDFNAELVGSNTAFIGNGAEFVLRLTSGDFGGGSNANFVNIDFDSSGQVRAIAQESFYYGAFFYSEQASFQLLLNFVDPNIDVVSVGYSDDMLVGNHAANNSDAVVWSFASEYTGFYGTQIAFSQTTPLPTLYLEATSVPEPAGISLIVGFSSILVLRRINRRLKKDK